MAYGRMDGEDRVAELQLRLAQSRVDLSEAKRDLELAEEELSRIEEDVAMNDVGSRLAPPLFDVESLEKQLMQAKVALGEAKVVREALQAEAKHLKQRVSFAMPRPKPGRIQRVEANAEQMDERRRNLDRNPKRDGGRDTIEASLEVGVAVAQSGMEGATEIASGTVRLDRHAIRVKYDFPEIGESAIKISRANLSVSQIVGVDAESDSNLAKFGLMKLRLRRGGNLDPLHFVSLRATALRLRESLRSLAPADAQFPTHERGLGEIIGSVLPPSTFGRLPTAAKISAFGASLVERISQSIHSHSKDSVVTLTSSEMEATVTSSPVTSPTIGPHLAFREPSAVLLNEQLARLASFLPSRFRDNPVSLSYSTRNHGISIQTFYVNLANKCPTLIIIKDSSSFVFGAFASAIWKQDKAYYGTGETFVFSIAPSFAVYKWARSNSYFQFSSTDFIALGGGDHYALWLDRDLYHGTSGNCSTFDSPCLASSEEFTCSVMEVWTFDLERR